MSSLFSIWFQEAFLLVGYYVYKYISVGDDEFLSTIILSLTIKKQYASLYTVSQKVIHQTHGFNFVNS